MTADEARCLLCRGSLEEILPGMTDTRFGCPGVFYIARCMDCGLEQTIPRLSDSELSEMYEAYYNFYRASGKKVTFYTRLREWFLTSALYKVWLVVDGDISFHSITGKGHLLDVGCNEGRGLVLYGGNGFTTEGLEINPVAAEVARKRGFTVHEGTPDTFEPTAAYDVAVLSNVLEHSSDPRVMLERIHALLNPGGEVWISCPNSQSWLRGLFGRSWINWHVPFHIIHFSPSLLKKLLQNTGFRILTCHQETPALWAAQSTIANHFARPGEPTNALRNPLLVVGLMALWRFMLFPLLWLKNRQGHGDCLVLRAKRAS